MIDPAREPLSAGRNGMARPSLMDDDRRIGSILSSQGKIARADIERVLELQQSEGLRFGEASLRLRLISAADLRQAIATQYEVPHLLPDNARVSRELVVAFDPFHRCAEQLRALRTQLLVRAARGEFSGRRLAVVGVARGEGRSYLAANLAVSFAQLGRRTLLIDADLRQPRLHRIFDVPDRVGLSAVLDGRADGDATVALPEFGSLWLLPAGACPPNPVELLSRDTLPVLLAQLQPQFDIVLFDTPPVQACADAHSVALRCGNAIVVARRGCSRLQAVEELVSQLDAAGTHVVGTVFNAA